MVILVDTICLSLQEHEPGEMSERVERNGVVSRAKGQGGHGGVQVTAAGERRLGLRLF